MQAKDLGRELLPTDERWQCAQRSCGCWRSVNPAEHAASPKCPICGSEMKLTTHRDARDRGSRYPEFFYAVSVIGAVALLLLFVYLLVQ